MNLFRHLFAHTPVDDIDMGNIGEVVAYPPPGIPSLPSDPCDETMPTNPKDPRYVPAR